MSMPGGAAPGPPAADMMARLGGAGMRLVAISRPARLYERPARTCCLVGDPSAGRETTWRGRLVGVT